MKFLFFKTIADVGYYRIQKRINFEFKKFLYNKIPSKFFLKFIQIPSDLPSFSDKFNYLEKGLNFTNKNSNQKFKFEFTFLNERKLLKYPFKWNCNSRKRLWQFNLHYFDWLREILDKFFLEKIWVEEASYIEYIIDDWIDNNPISKGDGWHSYTISLRSRNLFYLYRLFPNLINQKRLKSLWHQICWLNSNIEEYYGGNHLLENLISLCIGSLQFDGKDASAIYESSIKMLQKELEEQILNDGGHFERSASYHLLMLDRLCELGFLLQGGLNERPEWLVENIRKMTFWVNSVRLKNGSYPIFNDSPISPSISLDDIFRFAKSYLNGDILEKNSLRNYISNKTINNSNLHSKISYLQLNFTDSQEKLIDLPNTGWTLIRPGNGYELIFKCGTPCPKYLPAHVHSDLLSFDLHKHGKPIIVETGTSNYENSNDRLYERSAKAHNIFQLSEINFNNRKINWIEPVEVWDKFRAARKANIIKRSIKDIPDQYIFLRGAHDASLFMGIYHERSLVIKNKNDNSLILSIRDYVDCAKPIYWRQYWHLAPNCNNNFLKEITNNLKVNCKIKNTLLNTWYSPEFGKKFFRKSLCISGAFSSGINEISIDINLNS